MSGMQLGSGQITVFAVITKLVSPCCHKFRPSGFSLGLSKPEDNYLLIAKKIRQEDVEGNSVRTWSQ